MLAKNNTEIRLDRKIPHYCQCEPEPDKMKINQKKCRMKKYIREKPKKIYQKSQIHILLLLLFFSSFSTFLKSIYFIYHFFKSFRTNDSILVCSTVDIVEIYFFFSPNKTFYSAR